MKTKLVFCSVFLFIIQIVYSQDDSTLNIIHDRYYSGHSRDELIKIDQLVNQFYYFDKDRSIGNLIDAFGQGYFDLTFEEAREKINHVLSPETLEEMQDDEWLDTHITWLFDTLSTGSILYPEQQIWDSFLEYDFPKSPFHGSWEFSGPNEIYNYVSVIQTSFDSSLNIITMVNGDSIVNQIERIENPRKRWEVFFLFLQNIFVNELDWDLAGFSYQFINNVLEEEDENKSPQILPLEREFEGDTLINGESEIIVILPMWKWFYKFGPFNIYENNNSYDYSEWIDLHKKRIGDTLFYPRSFNPYDGISLSETKEKYEGRFGIKSLLNGNYLVNPYEEFSQYDQSEEVIDTKEKLKWVIGSIKFLASRGCLYYGNMSRYFGVAYALLEDDESLIEEYNLVQSLEIQYFNLLSEKFLLDQRFPYESFRIIQEGEFDTTGSPNFVFFRQNYYLAQLALTVWDKESILRKDYGDLYRLQIAQWLFNASKSVELIELDQRQKLKWKIRFYTLLSTYYRQDFELEMAIACHLKVIREFITRPDFFSVDDLNTNLAVISLLHRAQGDKQNFQFWRSYVRGDASFKLSFLEFMPKLKESHTNGVQKISFLLKFGLNLLLSTNEIGSHWGQPDLDDPIRYVMVSYEIDRANKKRYRKAFKIHQYLELYGDPRNTEDFTIQTNLRNQATLETLRHLVDQDRKKLKRREKALDSLSHLYGEEVVLSHSNILNLNYDLEDQKKRFKLVSHQIEQKEHLLESLKDLIQVERDKLNHMMDTTEYYQGLNNALKQDNADLEDDKIELQGTVEQQHQILVNRNWIIGVVTVFALLILIAFFIAWKNYREAKRQKSIAEEQRSIAQYQKEISDNLRFAIGQLSHVGRNSIGKHLRLFLKKPEEDQERSLENIQDFFQGFEYLNKNNISVQSILEDSKLGLRWVQIDFAKTYFAENMDSCLSIKEKETSELQVPVYVIMNIIHNSFKYSIKRHPIKIEISSKSFPDYHKVVIQDFAKKFDDANDQRKGHGVDYISRALDSFNGNMVNTEFVQELNEMGFKTSFNVKKGIYEYNDTIC